MQINCSEQSGPDGRLSFNQPQFPHLSLGDFPGIRCHQNGTIFATKRLDAALSWCSAYWDVLAVGFGRENVPKLPNKPDEANPAMASRYHAGS